MSTLAFTGLHGEIGSLLLEKLASLPTDVVDLFNNTPSSSKRVTKQVHLNLLQKDQIPVVLATVKPDILIHLAGITHIDRCEEDRQQGKQGVVWRTNVDATTAIAQYCADNSVKLIYLSTECVFDGKQKKYKEEDKKNPINWYGMTKAAAEDEIIKIVSQSVIARAVIAYSPVSQKTLWQQVVEKLKKGEQIMMADDHWMTPTFLDDIARFIDISLEKEIAGIYHITPPVALTPYQFASKIASRLGYSTDALVPTALQNIMGPERANLRLRHASLDSEFTRKVLGFTCKSLDEVLATL